MDTYEIFNGYLTGEERENAIAIAEANNMIDKGFALLEMCIIQEAQMIKDAELKVFKESGTYDDYGYLVSEAEAQANENKKGALATIIDGISSLIKSLFNSIRGIFKKADPEATVEIDKDTNGALAWIDKANSSISSLGDSIAKGESIPDIIKKIGVPTAAASGAVVTVKVLNDKYNILDKAFKKVDGGIQAVKNLGADFLQKHPKVNEGLNTVQNFLNTHISPLLNKIGGFVGKATTAVKDGANAVKDKAGEVAGKVKDKVTGNNNQEQQGVTGNANDPQQQQNLNLQTDANGNPVGNSSVAPQQVNNDANAQGGLRLANQQPVADTQQAPQQANNGGLRLATNYPNAPMGQRAYISPSNRNAYYFNNNGDLVGVYDVTGAKVNDNNVPVDLAATQNTIRTQKSFPQNIVPGTPAPMQTNLKLRNVNASTDDVLTDLEGSNLLLEYHDDGLFYLSEAIPTEYSIYGESEEIEDEESLADLFDSL